MRVVERDDAQPAPDATGLFMCVDSCDWPPTADKPRTPNTKDPSAAWTGERGFVGGTKDATGLTRIGAPDREVTVTTDPRNFRVEVLLSFQRALWDMVTPSLRGVAVRPAFPDIQARFLYEQVYGEDREIVSEVEAYVAADFLPPVMVKFEAEVLPIERSRELRDGEVWAYLRREVGGS